MDGAGLETIRLLWGNNSELLRPSSHVLDISVLFPLLFSRLLHLSSWVCTSPCELRQKPEGEAGFLGSLDTCRFPGAAVCSSALGPVPGGSSRALCMAQLLCRSTGELPMPAPFVRSAALLLCPAGTRMVRLWYFPSWAFKIKIHFLNRLQK